MTEMESEGSESGSGTGREELQLRAIAERLERERPAPRPAFRRRLGRNLIADPAESRGRIRLQIGVYATAGAALLLVAVIGVAGGGPLAA